MTISKRHLGLACMMVGMLGAIGFPLYEVLRQHPFGGTQIAAIGGCILLIAIGASLVPLGDQPL